MTYGLKFFFCFYRICTRASDYVQVIYRQKWLCIKCAIKKKRLQTRNDGEEEKKRASKKRAHIYTEREEEKEKKKEASVRMRNEQVKEKC
jgi:hypothetical protein